MDMVLQLKEILLGQLEEGKGEVVVDGAGVDTIDLPVLQVIWSARKSLLNQGRKLRLDQASSGFQRVQEDAGMMLDT